MEDQESIDMVHLDVEDQGQLFDFGHGELRTRRLSTSSGSSSPFVRRSQGRMGNKKSRQDHDLLGYELSSDTDDEEEEEEEEEGEVRYPAQCFSEEESSGDPGGGEESSGDPGGGEEAGCGCKEEAVDVVADGINFVFGSDGEERVEVTQLIRADDEDGGSSDEVTCEVVSDVITTSDDVITTSDDVITTSDDVITTSRHYADNLKIFERSTSADNSCPNIDSLGHSVKLKRTTSLSLRKEHERQPRRRISPAATTHLISELLEISKTFRQRRRYPFQKSISAMNLRFVDIEEEGDDVSSYNKTGHKPSTLPRVGISEHKDFKRFIERSKVNGRTRPDSMSSGASSGIAECDHGYTPQNHEDPDRFHLPHPGGAREDPDITPRNLSWSSSLQDPDLTPRPVPPYPEIILSTLGDSPTSCASRNGSSESSVDSCPTDSGHSVDSCPCDSDPDVFSDNLPVRVFGHRDRLSQPSDPRRGRMSVVTPPSTSKLEIDEDVCKRRTRSCGDLTTISDDLYEYVKKMGASKPGGLPEEMLEELFKAKPLERPDDAPGKLKRSSSQTITEREIKKVSQTKSLWDVPSMVKNSKIALAILFIGGKLGSVVQNNLNHVTQVAADDKSIGGALVTLPIIKSSLHAAQMQPKKGNFVGRSFSFTMRNKAGMLANKRYPKPNIPKTSREEGSISEISEEDLTTPLPSPKKKSHSRSLTGMEATADPLSDFRDNKRCMSLDCLNNPVDYYHKDLRKIAGDSHHPGGATRFNSSERLLSPDGSSGIPFHSSCDNLSRGRSEVYLDQDHRKSCYSTDGKNDSSNEFSSDSEEREGRNRLNRSKSISVVTKNMGLNLKSALKNRKRCPPHHFVANINKHNLDCEYCGCEPDEAAFVRCTNCEYLVHKTCSLLTLETSPPQRDKKPHKKINWTNSKAVNLLNKRPSSDQSMKEPASQNGVPKRMTSMDLQNRRVSVTDTTLYRPSSPIESDEDYFSDDSAEECWKESVDREVQTRMDENDKERMHGIFELINTEKNHIRDLKILIKIFREKLTEKRYITAEDREQLFPALDNLLASCSNLYSELKTHMDGEVPSPHLSHQIGDILVAHFSHATPAGVCIRDSYARLGARKIIAEKYYRDKCKDKAFKSLMDSLESKKLCKRRTYGDFLLAVATRLTKYPPLLKNLFKHTPESHPDHGCLRDAIEVVGDALKYVDNFVMLENQKTELIQCQTRLEVKGRCSREFKNFDLTSRTLIHKDYVTLQSLKPGSSKDSKFLMFLYSDYILLLKEKENKLILNFDDAQCPAIKVNTQCLVKSDNSQKACFMLVTNSRTNSVIRPTLYRFNAKNADDKETWIRLLMKTVMSAEINLELEDQEETQTNTTLSSDERYDDEEDSDDSCEIEERELSVSFDHDTVVSTTDTFNSDTSQSLTTTTSERHAVLDDIEEIRQAEEEEEEEEVGEEYFKRTLSLLRSLGGGGRRKAFNRPLPRVPRAGAAARRAISLHLSDKQKKVEENRRHTTCLSKEELNQAMSHTNPALPSNQTLQDNPVRQKSSDSGYAADEQQHQTSSSPIFLKMRDCILYLVQENRRKDTTIQKMNDSLEEMKRENAELRGSFTRLEDQLNGRTPLEPPSFSNHRTHRASSLRSFNNSNSTTYSITEEIAENPQTRV